MATQYLTRTRPFAVFIAAVLAFSIVQPALAQAPQPGGVPISTPTPDPNASLPVMAAPGAVQVQLEAQPAAVVQAAPVTAATKQVKRCLEYKDGHMSCDFITQPDNPPTPPQKGTQNIKAVYDLDHFHATDSALDWSAHGIQFKPGKAPGYFPAALPSYAGNGAMNVTIKLIYYVPSYSGGCCSNQQARVNNLITWLEAGSQWLGTGSPSVKYNFSYPITYIFGETPRLANGNGNIGQVETDAGATCAFINSNPDPTQVMAMATSYGRFPEFAYDGPRVSNGFVTSHNQLSCNRAHVFFGYAYVGETSDGANDWRPIANANMMEDHVHYLEWLFWLSASFGYPRIGCNAMNPVGNLPGYNAATDFYPPSRKIASTSPLVRSLYECAATGQPLGPRNTLMARSTYYNGSWAGTGDAHYPLNKLPANDHLPKGVQEYNWYDTTPVWTGATSWWMQNPALYTYTGCAGWGCTQEGWFIYWMQRIPGRNNTATDRYGISYNQIISNNHYGWWGLYSLLD